MLKQSKSSYTVARVGCGRAVVGPCIACSLRSGVELAPEILYFAALSIEAKVPERKRGCTSNESIRTEHMDEARYLEVAKKVGGTLRSYTICSTLTSVQRLHNAQHFQNPAIPRPATPQPAMPHTRARQHLATPPTHAPCQAAEKRASNKTGRL